MIGDTGDNQRSEVVRTMAFLVNDTGTFTEVSNSSSPDILQDTVTSATLTRTLADNASGPFQRTPEIILDSEEELPPFLVPKFIQAIVTLILCAILISTTLCLITQLKKLCSSRGRIGSSLSDDVEAEGSGSSPTFKSNVVTPVLAPVAPTTTLTDVNPPSEDALINEETSVPKPVPVRQKTHEEPRARRSSSHRKTRASTRANGTHAKAVYLNVPGTQFVRRTSGPFGAETMAFVQETYRKPVKPPPSPELGFAGLPRANHHYN